MKLKVLWIVISTYIGTVIQIIKIPPAYSRISLDAPPQPASSGHRHQNLYHRSQLPRLWETLGVLYNLFARSKDEPQLDNSAGPDRERGGGGREREMLTASRTQKE